MALTEFMRKRFETYLKFKPINTRNFEQEFLDKYPTAMDEFDDYFLESCWIEDGDKEFYALYQLLGDYIIDREDCEDE